MAFPPELKMNSVPSGKAGVFDAIREETGVALHYISTLSILVFTNKVSAKPFTNAGTSSGCVRAVTGRARSFPPEARPEERDFLVSFVTGNPLLLLPPPLLSSPIYLFTIYLCVSVGIQAHTHRCLRRPEAFGSPAAGVKGACELPDLGAGNQTPIL